jgi:hypothetical protein
MAADARNLKSPGWHRAGASEIVIAKRETADLAMENECRGRESNPYALTSTAP